MFHVLNPNTKNDSLERRTQTSLFPMESVFKTTGDRGQEEKTRKRCAEATAICKSALPATFRRECSSDAQTTKRLNLLKVTW